MVRLAAWGSLSRGGWRGGRSPVLGCKSAASARFSCLKAKKPDTGLDDRVAKVRIRLERLDPGRGLRSW
jgi:hypothetical protein